MASIVDDAMRETVIGGMVNEAAAASGSRSRVYDQLAENAAALWTSALVAPTMLGAEAIGVMNRTRNNPTPVIQS